MRFNANGEALYGQAGTVYLDGSTPAALSGVSAYKPIWRSGSIILYLDSATNTLKQLSLPATITTVDTDTPSVIRGGATVWAMYDATNDRVETSHPLTLAGARLGDIDFNGRMAVLSDASAGGPITVYAADGSVLRTIDTSVSDPTLMRLCAGILVWQDRDGHWNIQNVSTGVTPNWVPQAAAVVAMVPITRLGTLYLLEQTPTALTFRPANRSNTYTLRSSASIFGIDGIRNIVGSAQQLRIGCCSDVNEAQTSFLRFDVAFTSTDAVDITAGTVTGGGIIVDGPAEPETPVVVPVGPDQSGGATIATANDVDVPQVNTQPLTSKDGKITREWLYAWNGLTKAVRQLASNQSAAPTPIVPPAGGGSGSGASNAFANVAASGQPTLTASALSNTLTFTSSDGTIAFTLTPASNTADLITDGYWSELTNGDPVTPELIFAGGDTIDMFVPNP